MVTCFIHVYVYKYLSSIIMTYRKSRRNSRRTSRRSARRRNRSQKRFSKGGGIKSWLSKRFSNKRRTSSTPRQYASTSVQTNVSRTRPLPMNLMTAIPRTRINSGLRTRLSSRRPTSRTSVKSLRSPTITVRSRKGLLAKARKNLDHPESQWFRVGMDEKFSNPRYDLSGFNTHLPKFKPRERSANSTALQGSKQYPYTWTSKSFDYNK